MSSKCNPKEQAIPVFIGFAGHREFRDNPGDSEKMTAAIQNILSDEYANTYKNTTFILLTELAKGADQLAAQAALDR